MATTSAIKPELPALKTPLSAPLSATYPSELRSPAIGTPTYIKREDVAMKTPITPPAAYLDFLTKLSPTLASPLSAGPISASRFTFEKPLLTSSTSSESIVSTASSASKASTAATEPAAVSRPDSPRSNASVTSSCSCDSKKSDTPVATSSKPTTTASVPSSPFVRPVSSRTPRRLHIPQSPYSPATVRSPVSARSPLSASSVISPLSSTMSPREWAADKEPLSAGSTRTVSVRQVVRRTVQYSARVPQRAPIVEPVPASKKRKLDG